MRSENMIALFVAFLFSASLAFAGDVVAPQGNVRNVSVDDFMPHKNSTKDFNETWSYQFVFDNGTRAFINYSTLNIPGAGYKVTCDNGLSYALKIAPPEGSKVLTYEKNMMKSLQ